VSFFELLAWTRLPLPVTSFSTDDPPFIRGLSTAFPQALHKAETGENLRKSTGFPPVLIMFYVCFINSHCATVFIRIFVYFPEKLAD
jgi:hypothetical protein